MRARGCLGVLAGMQFLLLLVAGGAYLAGDPIGWGWVLTPVLVLLGGGMIFWVVLGLVWARFR